tara:strand:+ start:336 stop:536 length:201 start_codon:yes stop_codon:yes gene_type:complete
MKPYIELRDLKKYNQHYFKLKENSKDVYFVNHYNRGYKTYSVSKFDNINFDRELKASCKVFIDFTF